MSIELTHKEVERIQLLIQESNREIEGQYWLYEEQEINNSILNKLDNKNLKTA